MASPGAEPPQALRIAADIGGTFTDLALTVGAGGLFVHKLSSTPAAPEQAVIRGIAEILAMAGAAPEDVVEVLHGTTVGSNAILERKGARTGLLTTAGFRDVLEIGRLRTPELYDLAWDKPEPLIRRRHRLEVLERIGGQGEVIRALEPSSVVAAAERLLAAGIESLAICFINSYRNPAHEQQAAALLRARFPALDVSASFEILPQIKEYERTSTVAVNAYLRPVLRRYLERLADGLAGLGIAAPLLAVTSNGGMAGVRTAVAKPVFFVGSGPAAGVTGAAGLGRRLGEDDLIAFDMGGTTAKASLIEAGEVARVQEYEFRDGISSPSRFIKAGGYMLKVPAIDIAEVGAGGGSIASVDPGGLLRVGPVSAGAEPGPACYGLGGERPTVTDANLVLGYLNPAALAGGALSLDPALAERAIERELARPLGISIAEAAFGVRAVVNANMARAIRAVTIERGLDPRDFTLVAFGGGGPVHAADLAAMLGIRRVLLPSFPGVFTALGMLTSDVQLEFVRALAAPLDGLDPERAVTVIDALGREAAAALAAEGYAGDRQRVSFEADLRFAGQDSELAIPLQGTRLDRASLAALRAEFLAAYDKLFQYTADDPLELVNLRAIGRGVRTGRLDLGRPAMVRSALSGSGERAVLFERAHGPIRVPVVDRGSLVGGRLEGPLIIESLDTTIAVPPGATLTADAAGNLAMELAP
jgi:N-methylhydantoinase A